MENKLKELIMENVKFGNGVEALTEETDLSIDMGMDSIGLIKLFTDIETVFDMEFDYEAMSEKNLLIYGELKKYIVENMGNNTL